MIDNKFGKFQTTLTAPKYARLLIKNNQTIGIHLSFSTRLLIYIIHQATNLKKFAYKQLIYIFFQGFTKNSIFVMSGKITQ